MQTGMCACAEQPFLTPQRSVRTKKKGTSPCTMQSGSVEAHVRIREVAVHITNHTVRAGDRGLVVVGASAEQGDLSGEITTAV